VVGDEHGGGHRGAASSGKYSCDAPHRGGLASQLQNRVLAQLSLGMQDFFEAKKGATTCKMSKEE